MLLKEAIDAWHTRRVSRRTLTETSASQQKRNLDAFIDYVGPDRPVESITADDFEDWLAVLGTRLSARGKKYAERSINGMVSPVRTFFGEQSDRGHIPLNPCATVPNLKEPDPEPRWMSREDFDRLVEGVDNHRDQTLIKFMRLTGLRVSEVAAMRVEHWNRDTKTLVVRRAKTKRIQEIDIVGYVEEVLDAWVTYGLLDRREGPMWPSQKGGGALRKESITHIVGKIAKDVRVVSSPHRVRHTHLKVMSDDGASLSVVKEQAGHSSIASTQRYITASRKDVREAVEAQEAV